MEEGTGHMAILRVYSDLCLAQLLQPVPQFKHQWLMHAAQDQINFLGSLALLLTNLKFTVNGCLGAFPCSCCFHSLMGLLS